MRTKSKIRHVHDGKVHGALALAGTKIGTTLERARLFIFRRCERQMASTSRTDTIVLRALPAEGRSAVGNRDELRQFRVPLPGPRARWVFHGKVLLADGRALHAQARWGSRHGARRPACHVPVERKTAGGGAALQRRGARPCVMHLSQFRADNPLQRVGKKRTREQGKSMTSTGNEPS